LPARTSARDKQNESSPTPLVRLHCRKLTERQTCA
jgi:hypothetical protein